MGTNYYLRPRADCECCGRSFEPLHIGKSSQGWCFALHIIPEEGIFSFGDWRKRWNQPDAVIRDEYGATIAPDEMESVIAGRSCSMRGGSWDSCWWDVSRYRSEKDFHSKNSSERGPNFLLRHKVDGRYCVAHGSGTYDYMAGEFR